MNRTNATIRCLLTLTMAATLVGVAAAPARGQSELPTPGAAFGEYELVPLLDETVPYAGPPTPTSLEAVSMTDQVERLLDPAARATLAEQGFVVVPEEFRLFHHAYDEQYYTGTPVFLTTDAAYHTWHLIFDKTLRDLETKRLSPALADLLEGMRRNAVAQRQELAGTPLADDAARVVDLVSVALDQLGAKAGTLSPRANAEKALIDKHSAVTESPILGTRTDYTLFAPRGHYTRTKALTRYFKAMSVLGQHAFRLPGSVQTEGTVVNDVDGVRLDFMVDSCIQRQPLRIHL
jgi:hypothetical protein